MNVMFKRELNEQEWLIQQRIYDFWQMEDKTEAANFLGIEFADDPKLGELAYDLCALEIKPENKDKIYTAAVELMQYAQNAIKHYAENNKLPVDTHIPTLDDKFDEDCDAAVDFDDSLPYFQDD